MAGLAMVVGVPQAAKDTGISERSIRRYLDDPELAELATRKQELVDQEWWAFVQKGFRRTADLLDSTEDAQKAATATAIIYDKWALSRGQATTRSESRNLVDELDDHERAALRRAITGELDRREAEGTGPGAGVDATPASDPA